MNITIFTNIYNKDLCYESGVGIYYSLANLAEYYNIY
jgi:hypothetical protein